MTHNGNHVSLVAGNAAAPAAAQKLQVYIFWDVENVSVPRDVSPHDVIERIEMLFPEHSCDVRGFEAAFDVTRNVKLSKAFANGKVKVVFVDAEKKDAADFMITSMITEAASHYPGCLICLISSLWLIVFAIVHNLIFLYSLGDANFRKVLLTAKQTFSCKVMILHNMDTSEEMKKMAHKPIPFPELLVGLKESAPATEPSPSKFVFSCSRRQTPNRCLCCHHPEYYYIYVWVDRDHNNNNNKGVPNITNHITRRVRSKCAGSPRYMGNKAIITFRSFEDAQRAYPGFAQKDGFVITRVLMETNKKWESWDTYENMLLHARRIVNDNGKMTDIIPMIVPIYSARSDSGELPPVVVKILNDVGKWIADILGNNMQPQVASAGHSFANMSITAAGSSPPSPPSEIASMPKAQPAPSPSSNLRPSTSAEFNQVRSSGSVAAVSPARHPNGSASASPPRGEQWDQQLRNWQSLVNGDDERKINWNEVHKDIANLKKEHAQLFSSKTSEDCSQQLELITKCVLSKAPTFKIERQFWFEFARENGLVEHVPHFNHLLSLAYKRGDLGGQEMIELSAKLRLRQQAIRFINILRVMPQTQQEEHGVMIGEIFVRYIADYHPKQNALMPKARLDGTSPTMVEVFEKSLAELYRLPEVNFEKVADSINYMLYFQIEGGNQLQYVTLKKVDVTMLRKVLLASFLFMKTARQEVVLPSVHDRLVMMDDFHLGRAIYEHPKFKKVLSFAWQDDTLELTPLGTMASILFDYMLKEGTTLKVQQLFADTFLADGFEEDIKSADDLKRSLQHDLDFLFDDNGDDYFAVTSEALGTFNFFNTFPTNL